MISIPPPRTNAWLLGAPRRLLALPMAILAVVLAALGLTACGAAVSTSGFTGEKKAAAQRISDFQTDATARGGGEKKVCQNDLAAAVRARLQTAGSTCQSALKHQLTQIDTLELTIESIEVKGDRASARVKSTWSGKNRVSTLQLVREGSAWRISGLQ